MVVREQHWLLLLLLWSTTTRRRKARLREKEGVKLTYGPILDITTRPLSV
jgi:hypothetical protein